MQHGRGLLTNLAICLIAMRRENKEVGEVQEAMGERSTSELTDIILLGFIIILSSPGGSFSRSAAMDWFISWKC